MPDPYTRRSSILAESSSIHSQTHTRNDSNSEDDDYDRDPMASRRRSAPRGKCKFDGTDFPDWLPFNPFDRPDEPFAFPFPEVNNCWGKASQMTKKFDDDMCDAWVEEIQNLLVFAGLFSAVVTAFAVETQKLLRPDPTVTSVMYLAQISAKLSNDTSSFAPPIFQDTSPSISRRINSLIFVSLVLSLASALIGITALQWIRSYRRYEPMSHKEQLAARGFRYDALFRWKVPQMISILPLILQTALVVFFAGLVDFLSSSSPVVSRVVGAIIGAVLVFSLFTTTAPGLYALIFSVTRKHASYPSLPPYQSPQSWLFFRLLTLLSPVLRTAGSWTNIQEILCNPKSLTWTSFGSLSWFGLVRSLTWAFENCHDTDPFITLCNCFLSLESDDDRIGLIGLLTAESVNPQKIAQQHEIQNLDPSGNIIEVQLYFMLLDWADKSGIDIPLSVFSHAAEIFTRSMCVRPQLQLMPSTSLLWHVRALHSPYGQYTRGPVHMYSWLFTFLVSLQEKNSYFRDGSDIVLTEWFQFLFILLRTWDNEREVFIVDDTFQALASWMFSPPDQNEAESSHNITSCVKVLLNHMINSGSGTSKFFCSRPKFCGILDYLSCDQRGQSVWEKFHEPLPNSSRDTWNQILHNNRLNRKYPCLLLSAQSTDDDSTTSHTSRYGTNSHQRSSAHDVIPVASNVSRCQDSPPIEVPFSAIFARYQGSTPPVQQTVGQLLMTIINIVHPTISAATQGQSSKASLKDGNDVETNSFTSESNQSPTPSIHIEQPPNEDIATSTAPYPSESHTTSTMQDVNGTIAVVDSPGPLPLHDTVDVVGGAMSSRLQEPEIRVEEGGSDVIEVVVQFSANKSRSTDEPDI